MVDISYQTAGDADGVAMRYVNACLAETENLMGGADGRKPVLFLDYDGTLTPIMPRPEDAVLSDRMREQVRAIAALCPVAIVSGRDMADVRSLVDVDGLAYVGSHGLDISTASGVHAVGEPFRPAILRAVAALEKALASIPGAYVQPKRYAITVHTRLVASDHKAQVVDTVHAVLSGEPTLRYMSGKEMHELRPDMDWHKGSAVVHLAKMEGWQDHPWIFIGDDVTDEDGFRAVAEKGLGIRVGELGVTTAARLSLPDVDAVLAYLSKLQATLS